MKVATMEEFIELLKRSLETLKIPYTIPSLLDEYVTVDLGELRGNRFRIHQGFGRFLPEVWEDGHWKSMGVTYDLAYVVTKIIDHYTSCIVLDLAQKMYDEEETKGNGS